jgi:hypothetical protein
MERKALLLERRNFPRGFQGWLSLSHCNELAMRREKSAWQVVGSQKRGLDHLFSIKCELLTANGTARIPLVFIVVTGNLRFQSFDPIRGYSSENGKAQGGGETTRREPKRLGGHASVERHR